MAVALPDADVAGDAAALETIFLPDPDDRHVVATAIAASATLIVTSNLSDFPVGPLTRYGLEAVSPDEADRESDLNNHRSDTGTRSTTQHPEFQHPANR